MISLASVSRLEMSVFLCSVGCCFIVFLQTTQIVPTIDSPSPVAGALGWLLASATSSFTVLVSLNISSELAYRAHMQMLSFSVSMTFMVGLYLTTVDDDNGFTGTTSITAF